MSHKPLPSPEECTRRIPVAPAPDLGQRIRQQRGTDKPTTREQRIRAAMGTPSVPSQAAEMRTGQAPPPPNLALRIAKKQADDARSAVIKAIISHPPFIASDAAWLALQDEAVLARLAGLPAKGEKMATPSWADPNAGDYR